MEGYGALPERTTLRVCPTCGDTYGVQCAGTTRAPHPLKDMVEVEYVRSDLHQGAVDVLKLIAVSHAESAQHAIDVGLARNALEAMGVDPSLWRGQS